MISQIANPILVVLVLMGLLSPGIKAEAKREDSKSGESKLKKLYELTLPECITAYSVKEGKDGKNEIDKILTIAGIYEIDDKRQTKQIQKRTQELPDKTRCYPLSESFSPDGRYVVFE